MTSRKRAAVDRSISRSRVAYKGLKLACSWSD
jgi:hypothetical protein